MDLKFQRLFSELFADDGAVVADAAAAVDAAGADAGAALKQVAVEGRVGDRDGAA